MRTIVHLDADAFFAAVEQASDPKLRGKPIAVGGEKRGIIASASYEARKFGVYTPMPTMRARKLCPKLIVLPGDFERYEQFSTWMFSYAYDFTPDVEQTSIDEGYFDLSATRKSPVEIALTIRKAIGQKLKITVSEGLGTNKLVSAVASKLNKPAAFEEVSPGDEAAFLHPLANKWLPGVGPKMSLRLNAAGLVLIRHIAATPLDMLGLLLGNQAASIRQFAHGIDERPLIPVREPQKSFSQQETFASDLTDEGYVEATLRRMADNLFTKVREEGRSIRTLTVRVRYNDMGEDQTNESLREPTDLETDVYARLHTMLRVAWKRRVSLRLVSLKLSNVYDGRFCSELPLEISAQRQDARARLAVVIDELRKMRGHSIILRGHDFRLMNPPTDAAAPPTKPESRPNRRQIAPTKRAVSGYVPLRVHSHYSFLDSTLSPTTIVELAKRHGLSSVALTDTGNLHGAVEFVEAAKKAGVKPILGAEVRVGDHPLLLFVESAHGYRNLCRLLSRHAELAAARDDEGSVAARQRLPFRRNEFDGLTDGLIGISEYMGLAEMFPNQFYGMATGRKTAGEFPVAACPEIRYATPDDRRKYEIVQSIRTLTLLRQEHPDKRRGGRLHFRTPSEMAVGCQQHPDWLRHTFEIAERCDFAFPFGKPQFPAFTPPDGSPPSDYLRQLVFQGLYERYGSRADQFRPQVMEELGIINQVGYEEYFLITWDFLQECRRRNIEWITRGSAADSLVCYCLGISGVCPIRFDLYFRRFLNKERMALHKLPDIDIDFAHDLKDDVVKLIFEKYGREHCAVVGGFSTFQAKSAFAEVAKVLGVAEREVRKFTDHFPWSFGGGWIPDEPTPSGGARLIEMLRASPENRDLPFDEEPFKTALEMAEFLDGVPRNPKMHPCGVVLSRQTVHELTPTFIANKGYATTHFDMDAVETVGLVKMDILAQGGLAAMRDVKQMLDKRGVEVDLERCVARDKSTGSVLLGNPQAPEPWHDPNVWEMIASGEARAVHHIESPAMTGLCRMSNVREIDGLIAIVSVIRPGAANEGKKLAFTRRYQGLEPVVYPHPSLEACLRSTYGLVVYEEHILQLCEAFAGLSPGRADVLRRALNKQKRTIIEEIHGEFFASAQARGHTPEKTVEVWQLVTGFAGYAFCKAHSTAYGVEAYQSAWLKYYFPAEFMAAVLTNGKGFYHPLVYALESHRLGLKLLPPSVNEPSPAFVPRGGDIRVPLTRMKGLTSHTTDAILDARERAPFISIVDFFQRVAPSGEELEAMIRCGAFDEFKDTRTHQFWQAQHLLKAFGDSAELNQGWLISPPRLEQLPGIPLNEPTRRQCLEWETDLFGFAVSGHPLELFEDVAWETYCPVNRLGEFIGQTITTCGLVVEQRTHHQITGEPMKFLSLADWTGIVETELFAKTYKNYGLATVRYPVLEIEARVEPFENGRGFTLRALAARKPRLRMLARIELKPSYEIARITQNVLTQRDGDETYRMQLITTPLPAVQTQQSALTADVVAAGPLIPPLDRLRLMSDRQWEAFVLEWAHSLKTRYVSVERCGGAGDLGRDVIGFVVAGQAEPWDNFQCKHYDHALQPNDIWLELGKLCYYSAIGEYTFPREYTFVAPQGVGNSLSKLLRNPSELKTQLLAEWDQKCKSKITSTKVIPLDPPLLAHIQSLDFSRIKALSPLTLIDEHRQTPWHTARFGGGLPPRPPVPVAPAVPLPSEAKYVGALLEAYGDKLKATIAAAAHIPAGTLKEHFSRARQEFYNAEALRQFSKDNVPPGTFDTLLDEVESGIIDVVQATHPDAYERVLNAVQQAKTLPLASNPLVSRVTVSDKGGMCHQLANDEKVKWKT